MRTLLLAIVSLIGLAIIVLLTRGANLMTVGLVALAASPIALYAALKRPLDFPFAIYVVLVPFDNLLGTGPFGTITKLLGIVSGGFFFVWLVRRQGLAVSGAPVIVLGVLLTWMFASSLWSLDQSVAFTILPTYAGLTILYVVLTMMPISVDQYRRLLFLVAVGGLSAAVFGIRLFYQNPALTQQADDVHRLVIQVGQSSIDVNHFADSMLFPIIVVMTAGLRARNLLAKAVCVGALAVFLVAVLLSGSREALTAMVAIVIYFLWRSRSRLQVAAVAAVLVVTALSVTATSIWERFSTIFATGGSGRSTIWGVGLEAAKHRPIQGYGIGNFQQAYDLFYLSVRQPYPFGWDSPAHNLVLHYLVELGVIGLGLIVLFFVAQFRSLRVIQPSDELYDYRVMMEAALLAIAVVSMTIDLFTYKYAWLVFAMVALLRNCYAGQASAAMRPTSSSMMPARSARPSTRFRPDSPSRRSALSSSSAN
ncbi:MAG TPA: O-antigen ligase family protein [Candidatus Acidoferrales bacterium]|nr:O-antigen ligase family protein [Candidatus Acidoferrales bacterium]